MIGPCVLSYKCYKTGEIDDGRVPVICPEDVPVPVLCLCLLECCMCRCKWLEREGTTPSQIQSIVTEREWGSEQ